MTLPDFLEIGDNLGVAGENVTAMLFPFPPITVQHVSAYRVVRAIPPVNGR